MDNNNQPTTTTPTTQGKVEKISLREIKQETEKMQREEEQATFQKSVEDLFLKLVDSLKDVPPEALDEYLDEAQIELEEKRKNRSEN